MRPLVLCLAVILGCGDSSGPGGGAFDVDVRIETSPVTGACRGTWTATATDPTVTVTYTIDDPGGSLAAGSFQGSRSLLWDFALVTNVELSWTLTAAGFSESRTVNVGCGSSWQEP